MTLILEIRQKQNPVQHLRICLMTGSAQYAAQQKICSRRCELLKYLQFNHG